MEDLWQALLDATLGGSVPPSSTDPLIRAYADFVRLRPDGLSVLAHLGQTLDGRIATTCGHSFPVTSAANITHLHRLRALADAVLVGAGTVAHDDPLLTTRHARGPDALRVVLDPDRRLGPHYRLFTESPATLVLCRSERKDARRLGEADIMPVEGQWSPQAVLRTLRARGVRRIFIEGGGVTVSSFLWAHALDRLQICVAPKILGSGRASLQGRHAVEMSEALQLSPTVIPMGEDVLFDITLSREPISPTVFG